MHTSYTGNYIKIYIWQGISLIMNFLSMFIVIPYLTSNPTIYGVYSICISVSIFLSYADLGFLSAGQKYAAEYFVRDEIKKEIQVIGFTSFVLLVFLLLFSIGFLYLSFHPELLIKNILQSNEMKIASSLLFILALFTPVTMLQRLLQMIFGIRLEDFIVQRSNIVANIFKIFSILIFFRNGKYNIVGYFLFMQITNLLAALITLIIAKKRYNYDFKMLIISLKFNKVIFSKTKKLAFTSFYLTIAWILYYELDSIAIGKLFGAQQVAIYAIGLTILSFFRSILGIIYSPFNARFNHFIGIKNLASLKTFYLQVTTILAPIVVLPTLTVVFFAKPIVTSWVGSNYLSSVELVKYLVLCNVLAFITYPAALLLMAQERIKEMYFVNTIIPFIFWGGIIFTYTCWGLKSFVVFKLIAFGISGFAYYYFMLKFLGLNLKQSLIEIIYPLFFPLLFLIVSSLIIKNYLPIEKSKLNLLIVGTTTGCIILISFIIQYFSSHKLRRQFAKTLNFKNK